MRALHRGAAVLAFAFSTLAAENAHALATLELIENDAPGVGFNDPTPATPVGGNMGTTIGEQRRIAFEYALGLWGNVLESPAPILVSISFSPLLCSDDTAVLGQAGPAATEFDVPGGDASLVYPEALADEIAGADLMPGFPDIEGEFNGSLADCFGVDWYYGLDGKHSRELVDLVSVVLHEVGHGLGFLTLFDPETGQELATGYSDPFSEHLLDLGTTEHWPDMTAAERMASATSVRGLVWDGQFVTQAAATWLTPGAPHVAAMPAVQGFADAAVDGNFGPRVTAPIMGMPAGATPSATCEDVTPTSGSLAGTIAVVPQGNCHPMNVTYAAESAGALAVLITDPGNPPANLDVPAEDLPLIPLGIPAFAISEADAESLLAATGTTVTLSANPMQRTGTDSGGRVYIYASSPVSSASTASHWDTILRPDPIEEPADSPNTTHDITLERALLRDIGWATRCGNGMPDPGEECDNGTTNSDTAPNACRTSCRHAFCADGVVDTGETCDPGPSGSVDPSCTETCTRPVCGNTMVEAAEECDDGPSNSDTAPNACRTTCKRPSCGDGVVDSGEQCELASSPGTCLRCMMVVGTGGTSAGGTGPGGSAGTGANVGTGGGNGSDGHDGGGKDDDGGGGGCGCRVAGRDAGASRSFVLAALAVASVFVRRRLARG